VFEHAREVGGGAFEGEDEAMGAGGGDADGGEVFGFAAVELGGAFEEVEHFGVGGAEFGGEDALEGVEVVGGGDGGAIAPGGVRAEVEGPGLEVRTLPGGGEAGGVEVGVGGVGCDEAFEEGGDDPVFGLAGDDMGIQGLDVGAIADKKGAGGGGGAGWAGGFRAACEAGAGGELSTVSRV
jgi:hypothetical protein